MIDPSCSRRDLLRLSASALAIVSGAGTIATLAGCGGGGESATAESSTRVAVGRINTAELGGTGHQILSARAAAPAAASADGSFSTDVAAENAQMLVVRDANGTPRGLALALPGEPLTIGASSTALALVFSTPGLMASDPDLAREAIDRLRAQPRFPALVSAVTARLPEAGLTGLKTAEIDALVLEIVEGTAADTGRGTNSTESSILFKGAWGKRQSATAQGVDLTQEGFRYVRVDLQRLDPSGQRLTHEVARTSTKELTAMDPAGLASIGQLLVALRKGISNSPSQKTAIVDLATPVGTGRLKFYVSGIGLGANKETLPFTLSRTDLRESYAKTLFFILVMPFLNVYLGGLGAKKISTVNLDRLNVVYSGVGTRLSMDGVFDALEGGDWGAISASLIDYTLAAFAQLGPIIDAYGATGLSGPLVTIIATAAAAGGLVISAANLALIHAFLNRAPAVQSIELQVSEVEGTVQ